jgi:hypothetical protein
VPSNKVRLERGMLKNNNEFSPPHQCTVGAEEGSKIHYTKDNPHCHSIIRSRRKERKRKIKLPSFIEKNRLFTEINSL